MHDPQWGHFSFDTPSKFVFDVGCFMGSKNGQTFSQLLSSCQMKSEREQTDFFISFIYCFDLPTHFRSAKLEDDTLKKSKPNDRQTYHFISVIVNTYVS